MMIHEESNLLEQLSCLNEDVPPMPAELHAGWMQKVEENAMPEKKKLPLRTLAIRTLSTAAAAIFVVCGAISAHDSMEAAQKASASGGNVLYRASSPSPMMANYQVDEAYDYMEEDYAAGGYGVGNGLVSAKAMSNDTGSAVTSEKKIIRSASLSIGTQTFQSSLDTLKANCLSSGGWIESASENTNGSGLRVAYLTLRVPSAQLDAFLEKGQQLGRMIRYSENSRDATESYQDTTALLNTQLALMNRLQALVTDAADLSDLLELESQIADTQYTIDRLKSSLNATDRQVDYSTVNVTLQEESVASDITDTDKTLWQRLQSAVLSGMDAFAEFMSNVFVYAAAALPFAAVVLLVWGGVWLVRKWIRNRRMKP